MHIATYKLTFFVGPLNVRVARGSMSEMLGKIVHYCTLFLYKIIFNRNMIRNGEQNFIRACNTLIFQTANLRLKLV